MSKELYAPALGGIMLSIGIRLSIEDFALAFKRSHLSFQHFFFPSDLSLRFSPVITLLHLLQAFTTLCWVHGAVCVEASSRGTNCKGVPHAADVLRGLCPYLLCCRGSAV